MALPSILSLYQGHQGKFLVATGALNGTSFEETVIYLEYHGAWGARGVIFNKPLAPSDWRPDSPLEKEEGAGLRLMRGGPVPTKGAVWLILRGDPPSAVEYNALWPSEKIPDVKSDEHFFAGFSRWRMLQLNREITRGAWGVIDYDPALMFNTPPKDIWPVAIKRVLQERPAESGGV